MLMFEDDPQRRPFLQFIFENIELFKYFIAMADTPDEISRAELERSIKGKNPHTIFAERNAPLNK